MLLVRRSRANAPSLMWSHTPLPENDSRLGGEVELGQRAWHSVLTHNRQTRGIGMSVSMSPYSYRCHRAIALEDANKERIVLVGGLNRSIVSMG